MRFRKYAYDLHAMLIPEAMYFATELSTPNSPILFLFSRGLRQTGDLSEEFRRNVERIVPARPAQKK